MGWQHYTSPRHRPIGPRMVQIQVWCVAAGGTPARLRCVSSLNLRRRHWSARPQQPSSQPKPPQPAVPFSIPEHSRAKTDTIPSSRSRSSPLVHLPGNATRRWQATADWGVSLLGLKCPGYSIQDDTCPMQASWPARHVSRRPRQYLVESITWAG